MTIDANESETKVFVICRDAIVMFEKRRHVGEKPTKNETPTGRGRCYTSFHVTQTNAEERVIVTSTGILVIRYSTKQEAKMNKDE